MKAKKTRAKGGFVEGLHNLSEQGTAWISEDSKVYDNAYIEGDALVCDNATVRGNVYVHDNAIIGRGADISGDIEICGKAYIMGVTMGGSIRIGGDAFIIR